MSNLTFRDRTILGRTGLEVSRLGIGSGYGVPAAAVERAFHEHGINYLYWSLSRRGGMTEAIGLLAPNHRDEMIIVMQTYDHSGFFIERAHERGLRKLGIDHADVLIANHTLMINQISLWRSKYAEINAKLTLLIKYIDGIGIA